LSFDIKSLCLACNNPTFNDLTHPRCKRKYTIDGCISALTYNKNVQKLIFNFKHKPYLTDLKTILSELFYESIIQNEQFQRQIKKGEWILAPIPLSEARLRKRGYNQAQILAEELSQKLNFPMQNLLERTRETKTQGGLTTSQRKLNIKNAFKLKIEDVKHKNIFLVDDVVTTGSTLLEAARVLKRGGVQKVFGLTLARD
jgi:competence protein ComFC